MMKRTLIFPLAVALSASPALAETAFKDQKEKVSYSIGLDIGNGLKRSEVDVNLDILEKGLQDGVSGAQPQMTEEEIQKTMQAFQEEMRAKMEKAKAEQGEKNKKEGTAFLEENKKKEGVVTLPSGLQYQVITEGKGAKPKNTDTVKTHYRGTLINGTEFDSSHKQGQPATFPVVGVIPGWTEALQLMPVGSKWKLFVPSELAYGENGPPMIGPNATLIFEVELLDIEKPVPGEIIVKPEPIDSSAGKPAEGEPAKADPSPAKKE